MDFYDNYEWYETEEFEFELFFGYQEITNEVQKVELILPDTFQDKQNNQDKQNSIENNVNDDNQFHNHIEEEMTADEFRERYNRHFNHTNKPVRKEIIQKYHRIMQNMQNMHPTKIGKMEREVQRHKNEYFTQFCKYGSFILKSLEELERKHIINYEEDKNALTLPKRK